MMPTSRTPVRPGAAWWVALVPFVASAAIGAPLRRSEVPAPSDLVPIVDGRVPVVVETADPAGVAARVAELGGTVTYVFENVAAVSALVPETAMRDLAADARVSTVQRQRLVREAVSEPRLLQRMEDRGYRMDRTRFRSGAGATRSLDARGIRFVPVPPSELRGGDEGPASTFLGYDEVTRAAEVWEDTDFGEGALVAIIDTGVYPAHPLIDGAVVGGMNLVPAAEEEAIDVDGDHAGDGYSFDWDAVQNDDHGTFCAGLIAGHADLELPSDDPLAESIAYHAPDAVVVDGDVTRVRLFGTAPAASIYAIKVFPFRGGSAPDARIGEALDFLIRAKRCGSLDVDVISMSLSGPVLDDGRYFLDRLVDEATRCGMTCVMAASNEGPSQVSVGSPASSFHGLAAGAAIDPVHLRVAIEALFGLPVGMGDVAYPFGLQVADFSSRGLTADGRVKPQILASGFFAFSATLEDFTGDGIPDGPSFGMGSGTSFATPTVAGGAALAAVSRECGGHAGRGDRITSALVRGADPIASYERISAREQGAGFMVLPAALGELHHPGGPPPRLDRRDPLTARLSLRGGTASGDVPALAAGESFDYYVDIPDDVGVIHVTFPTVTHTGDENPFLSDGLEVAVHSAKRGGTGDYVFVTGSLEAGDAFDWPFPEPGRARITFLGTPANYGELSASLSLVAEPLDIKPDEVFHGVLARDGDASHAVDVPAGTTAIGARLVWPHDWSRFPTYDLDMYIAGPDGIVPAASLDAPELAWIEAPAAGKWTFHLEDLSTVRGREPYRLEVVFEHERDHRTEPAQDPPVRPAIVAATPREGAPGTDLRLVTPQAGHVSLEVFDLAGRRVRTLETGVREAGSWVVPWDGRDAGGRSVASGVYFARFATDAGTSVRKIVVRR